MRLPLLQRGRLSGEAPEVTITGYLIGLLLLFALAAGLCLWAHLTLGDLPEQEPGRHERLPQHARWTGEGRTRKVQRRRSWLDNDG